MVLFKKYSWFYIPISFIGAFVLVVTLALNVQFFMAIDHHAHSVSDLFINFFPFCVSFWVVYGWIASNTSEKKSGKSQ